MSRRLLKKNLGEKSAQSNMNGILHSLVKACALGEEMGTPVLIPAHWEEALDEEIKRASAKLNAQQFCILGAVGFKQYFVEACIHNFGCGPFPTPDRQCKITFDQSPEHSLLDR